MNPQLTTSLMQTRQLDLLRGAEKARMAAGLPSRPNLLAGMVRSLRAPRLNLRAPRTEAASWNTINQM
jgi:hypothetical protein